MSLCHGSASRVGISAGQTQTTAGAVRPNRALNVRCPICKRAFRTARVTHTDHGIPTPPQAMIPRHRSAA